MQKPCARNQLILQCIIQHSSKFYHFFFFFFENSTNKNWLTAIPQRPENEIDKQQLQLYLGFNFESGESTVSFIKQQQHTQINGYLIKCDFLER